MTARYTTQRIDAFYRPVEQCNMLKLMSCQHSNNYIPLTLTLENCFNA